MGSGENGVDTAHGSCTPTSERRSSERDVGIEASAIEAKSEKKKEQKW